MSDTMINFYPHTVTWELTNRCNACCIHCGSRSGASRENELTENEALQLCEDLHELGTKDISIIGGEFFLSPFWEKLVSKLKGYGIKVNLLTNGILLNDENIQRLLTLDIRAISVSIDGIGEIHDYFRGVPGIYGTAIANIRKAKDAGMSISINTAVSKHNMHQLTDMFKILSDLGVFSWQLQGLEDYGRAKDNPSLALTVEDLYAIVKKVAELRKDSKMKIFLADNIGYFTCFEKEVRDKPFGGCIAGRYNLGIQSNGDLRGCLALLDECHSAGNIRQRSLKEIWTDPNSFKEFRYKPLEKMCGFCSECDYAVICRAGCPSLAYSLTGSYYENPHCLHKYEVENGLFPLEALRTEAGN